ncbi:MAG: hypothetical protein R3B52_01210 [Candidatus Paceibacterota bacterium]
MKKRQKKVAAEIGLGVALAAAAAAVYAFSGKEGKKRRKKVTKWANDMKRDAIHALKSSKKMTKKMYGSAVDDLKKKYAKLDNVDKQELALLAVELKKGWEKIHKAATTAHKTPKKTTKKKTARTKKKRK